MDGLNFFYHVTIFPCTFKVNFRDHFVSVLSVASRHPPLPWSSLTLQPYEALRQIAFSQRLHTDNIIVILGLRVAIASVSGPLCSRLLLTLHNKHGQKRYLSKTLFRSYSSFKNLQSVLFTYNIKSKFLTWYS